MEISFMFWYIFFIDLIRDTREKFTFTAIVKKCYKIAENPPITQAYDLPKVHSLVLFEKVCRHLPFNLIK